MELRLIGRAPSVLNKQVLLPSKSFKNAWLLAWNPCTMIAKFEATEFEHYVSTYKPTC